MRWNITCANTFQPDQMKTCARAGFFLYPYRDEFHGNDLLAIFPTEACFWFVPVKSRYCGFLLRKTAISSRVLYNQLHVQI